MGGVAWTEEEDHLLRKCIEQYGEGKWHRVPLLAGLNRCRKSCRLRWLNYLRPNIRRGSFEDEEVELIIKLHKLLGNRWSLIAGRLPGRTANDVKNYWNCHLSKRLTTATSQDHAAAADDHDTELQLTSSVVAAAAPIEIIRSHPSNNIINYGQQGIILQEEYSCTTSTARATPPPLPLPPPVLFVDEGSSSSSNWVLGGGTKEHEGPAGFPGGGGEKMIGMDHQFRFESCSSAKWDWDDLIGDLDRWGESL